jgi:hypothetical protein
MTEQIEIQRASARFIENGVIPETVRRIVASSWHPQDGEPTMWFCLRTILLEWRLVG